MDLGLALSSQQEATVTCDFTLTPKRSEMLCCQSMLPDSLIYLFSGVKQQNGKRKIPKGDKKAVTEGRGEGDTIYSKSTFLDFLF